MRNLKRLLLIAVFSLGLAGVANAQKVGHINAEKLLANMPATKTMQKEMEKLGKTYKDELQAMVGKLEDKMKKYQAEAATQTQAINEKRGQEVQQDRAKMAQYEKAAYEEMQKKQAERLKPILEKAQKAIEEVAATKGIVYVLDASPGKGLLVFQKGEDIYNAVKAKLGF